jgi:hypothetical protein
MGLEIVPQLLAHLTFRGMTMKIYSILLLCLITSQAAFAEDQKDASQFKFNDRKEEMIKGLDARIAALQKARSCAASAADQEALKDCHEELEKSRDEFPRLGKRNYHRGSTHRFDKERDKVQKN